MFKGVRGVTLIEVLAAICVALVVVGSAYLVFTHGEDDAEGSTVDDVSGWSGGLRDNLTTVCIDGFEYYFSAKKSGFAENAHSRAILAPVFDKKDRLPKKCRVERE